MYCTSCGKELPDGATRCDECGTPVAGAYQQNQNNWSADNGHSENGQSQNGQDGDNSYYQDNRSQYQYQYDYSN